MVLGGQEGGQLSGTGRAEAVVWKGGIRTVGGQHGDTKQVHHLCHQKVTIRARSLQINLAPNRF